MKPVPQARLSMFILAVVTAVCAALLPAQQASALTSQRPGDVPTVRDANDAPPERDLQMVRLYRNFKGWQTVQLYSDTWSAGPLFNGIEIRYDTRGGPGVDYSLTMGFTNDDDNFEEFVLNRKVGGRWVRVNCRGLRAKNRKDGALMEVYVARNCMRTSKKIGIRAFAWDFTRFKNGWPSRGKADSAPNRGWLR